MGITKTKDILTKGFNNGKVILKNFVVVSMLATTLIGCQNEADQKEEQFKEKLEQFDEKINSQIQGLDLERARELREHGRYNLGSKDGKQRYIVEKKENREDEFVEITIKSISNKGEEKIYNISSLTFGKGDFRHIKRGDTFEGNELKESEELFQILSENNSPTSVISKF